MGRRNPKSHYAICIDNESNLASLQLRKLYQILPDKDAETHNQIRVIDEDGEDYLYPSDCFITIDFDYKVIDALDATYAPSTQ
ncbi:MAG: hypothetical protein ACR2LZ_08115 [Pyrinomonadaceae bacterium]